MASSKPVPSGPCKQENEITKADIWCYNCDEGLCSSCFGHHKKFKSTRVHKTIDIHIYKLPIGPIKTECDKHNQQFKMSHSKRIGITSLADVVEKIKIEKSIESVDKLEQKLGNEVDTVWSQEKSKLTGFITEIEEKTKILKEMQDNLQIVTEQTSKFQSFLGLHQIGEKVHQCQSYVDDIENTDMAYKVDLQVEQNDEIEKILNELQSIKSLGEVEVYKTRIAIDRETTVNRKAQINKDVIAITYPIELAIKIFNIEDETESKVIKLQSFCCGLSFSNESLAVGLNTNEIRIIDLEGNTMKSINVQSKSNLHFLVYSDIRFIYSDYLGETVSCLDESGKQIWQYTQDLSNPEGLCTDTYGNIIVADRSSSRIIAISKDGQDSKVLVRGEDELKYPKCICLRNDESYGFVYDKKGKYFAKFNLSYD
ncbi:unnamed protein product [Mytilus edulis]|uniref:B box-type domain-containing protein n=1 Tax=Mytilus edulis TaxID=6550 RepID=A0A8S3RQP6_MYTED|nr:unnamed protein product [Mytilus edulis]